jgi:NAD(P)-dependent dehydrogenase (short-subunit alcohol dehydrogenase family)
MRATQHTYLDRMTQTPASPARIFITGSSAGLGLLAAQRLIAEGHEVVLHARNAARAEQARAAAPGAAGVLVGDLAHVYEIKQLAEQANLLAAYSGAFDAVIHNAGVYQGPNELLFTVNSLAPYLLTCLMDKPERLVYMSSGLHRAGKARRADIAHETLYNDTKLHMVLLARAVARAFPHVYANAVDPGWVPTRMGGPNAPDDLHEGAATQAWLCVSDEPAARVSGRYFHHRAEQRASRQSEDDAVLDGWIAAMEAVSGVALQ